MIWGMGNPLRRDDGAGVRAAELLLERLRPEEGYEIRICETQPENFLGLLRRIPPKILLICDASEMGLPPGSLGRFTPLEMAQENWSTHGYPLDKLLQPFLGAFPIICLGIQPESTEWGTELSSKVEKGVRHLVDLVVENRWEEIPSLAKKEHSTS
ncbi:MAG TPA: hydrogenase maturation protease [Synergistaceae bacterium]|nr:hydrogenase maturation protease [Synergistaceae bacterium]